MTLTEAIVASNLRLRLAVALAAAVVFATVVLAAESRPGADTGLAGRADVAAAPGGGAG